jgi:hypothetical protein
MKTLLLLLAFAVPAAAFAQNSTADAARTPPTIPTTKILAIGHIVPNAKDRTAIMPSEVRETVKLYLAGKIDQWYVRKDQAGVVFLMNVATVKEAHDLLEALPLGKAGIMEFELIPIGPLSPLLYLLTEPTPASAPPAHQ